MHFRVGIAGFRGYSGAELIRLLSHHPSVEALLLEHRESPEEGPQYAGHPTASRIGLDSKSIRDAELSIVFLATPPEVSMELAPTLLDAGCRVIDLSGAFRLQTPENYNRWYRAAHSQPELLSEAVYGLPEFYRDCIPRARLVANPGCYPTAANLAIRPLLRNNLIDR